MLAVADADAPDVRLFDAVSAEGAVLRTVRVHSAPVLLMRLNAAHDAVISVDAVRDADGACGAAERVCGGSSNTPGERVCRRPSGAAERVRVRQLRQDG